MAKSGKRQREKPLRIKESQNKHKTFGCHKIVGRDGGEGVEKEALLSGIDGILSAQLIRISAGAQARIESTIVIGMSCVDHPHSIEDHVVHGYVEHGAKSKVVAIGVRIAQA